MKVAVVGANGMLGSDVARALANHSVLSLDRSACDVTSRKSIEQAVSDADVIVNCAAFTQVDAAEESEDLAFAINAHGPQLLARVARERGARFVTFSTDYVFSGTASTPYVESERRAPKSAYGRTKAAGEEFSLAEHPKGTTVVRTAWLYGANGPNFARTMLQLAETRETWSVVDDQVGQPTWSWDVAQKVVELVERDAPPGIYHATNSGSASWFEFAQAVLSEAGLDPNRVSPTTSDSFVRPAPRPAYSVLGHGRWEAIGIAPLRPWRAALHAAFAAGVFEGVGESA